MISVQNSKHFKFSLSLFAHWKGCPRPLSSLCCCSSLPATSHRLLVERLRSLGVPPGPLYARLKGGETVVTADGREVRSAEVVGSSRPGRKLVVLGDTADSSQLAPLARDADVIVHEATNEAAHQEKARANGHSTPGEVATPPALPTQKLSLSDLGVHTGWQIVVTDRDTHI